jgi:hypothetical protein
MLAQKKADLSALRTRTGNSRSIDRLQRSAPEMVSKAKKVATPLASIQVERSSGVTSQASVLFQLMATRQSIADWIVESGTLHAQAGGQITDSRGSGRLPHWFRALNAHLFENSAAAIDLRSNEPGVFAQGRIVSELSGVTPKFSGYNGDGGQRRSQFMRGAGSQCHQGSQALTPGHLILQREHLLFARSEGVGNLAGKECDQAGRDQESNPHADQMRRQALFGMVISEEAGLRRDEEEQAKTGDGQQAESAGPAFSQNHGGERDQHQIDEAERIHGAAG